MGERPFHEQSPWSLPFSRTVFAKHKTLPLLQGLAPVTRMGDRPLFFAEYSKDVRSSQRIWDSLGRITLASSGPKSKFRRDGHPTSYGLSPGLPNPALFQCLDSWRFMLIIETTMFSNERRRRSWLPMSCLLFLIILLSSCKAPGNETKVKEKDMTAGDTSMAYKKEAASTKEVQPVATERATFALG
jgi:hypothetical protein